MNTLKRKLYSYIEDKYMNGCSDYNDIQVRRAIRSKEQARDLFRALRVPHAFGTVFVNPKKAYDFVREYGFPVVIKPNVWGFSRGSFFPINTYKELAEAILKAKAWWPSTVIESYLHGKNYRVVVTHDWVEVAMQRYPAFVIGNWVSTIAELIDFENSERRKMKLLPIIHEIKKTKLIEKHLKKQWLNFDTVLKKDLQVFLYHRVSLAPGWILETVELETISIKNKALFQKILDATNANILGIDVIMQCGIETDYDTQKTIFLELNSRPYLKMHEVPRYGMKPDMSELYEKLEKLDIRDQWIW